MDKFIIPVKEQDGEDFVDREVAVEDLDSDHNSADPELFVAQVSFDYDSRILLTRETSRILIDSLSEIISRYAPIEDDEIAAMRAVYRAMSGMDAEAEIRVLTWLKDKMKHERGQASKAAA